MPAVVGRQQRTELAAQLRVVLRPRGHRAAGVDVDQRAGRRRACRVEVADRDEQHLVLDGEPAQHRGEARRDGVLVGDDDEDGAAADGAGDVAQHRREVARRPRRGGSRRARRPRIRSRPSSLPDGAGTAGRPRRRTPRRRGRRAGSRGSRRRRPPSTARSRLGTSHVVHRGHAPAGRDREQHGVLARRGVPLDQQRAAAGRRLPVEVLHVVAADVLAQVVEVHAAAGLEGGVLPLQQAADLAVRVDRHPGLDPGEVRASRPVTGRDGANTASTSTSGRTRSASASKFRWMRCRSTLCRSCRTSSGITWLRPWSTASAARHLEERDGAARAGADLDVAAELRPEHLLGVPGGLHQVDDVALDRRVDVHPLGRAAAGAPPAPG